MAVPSELTTAECSAIAVAIESGLKRTGVAARPNSDLSRFIDDMRWLGANLHKSKVELGCKGNDRLTQAFIRAPQARHIANVFRWLRPSKVPASKLRVLKDRLDRLQEAGNSQAPDIFFELEVAGRLVVSDDEWRVSFEEPDVVVRYEDMALGFACKRPRTNAGLANCIERAAQQGATAELKCVVAVDTSHLLLPTGLFPVNTQRELLEENARRLADLVSESQDAIAKAFAKDALGIMFFSRLFGFVETPKAAILWDSRILARANPQVPGAAPALARLSRAMEPEGT